MNDEKNKKGSLSYKTPCRLLDYLEILLIAVKNTAVTS